MYAVHIGVYFLIGGCLAFYEFSVVGCLLLSVVALVATDLVVQGYIKAADKIKIIKRSR